MTPTGPFIPYGRHLLDEDDIAAVVKVLREGPLTQGPLVAEFEAALARYTGARYAVAVSSGTAALHLACLALGVRPGDRTITSPITFVATANCAVYSGASPDFCDIDVRSLNISPACLDEKLGRTPGVRAVLPVHFGGAPCDMPEIQRISSKKKAAVIEDAAHALGTIRPDGGRVGDCAHSDATIFSFHPVKLIAAGEGGAITTNREDVYRSLLLLRNHGIHKGGDGYLDGSSAMTGNVPNPWYYEMQTLGYHYRITDLQSALALSQLGKIEQFLSRRRELARRYDEAFAKLDWISPAQLSERERSAHHLYVVRIDFRRIGKTRAAVMGQLSADGIGTQVHYIPVHFQPYYRARGFKRGDFPVAEAYYEQALTLPLYPGMSDDDHARVVTAVSSLVP